VTEASITRKLFPDASTWVSKAVKFMTNEPEDQATLKRKKHISFQISEGVYLWF
jgi:hypothetical protein